jgi:hypothetical protein
LIPYLLHSISLAIANGAAELFTKLVILALTIGGEELGIISGLLAAGDRPIIETGQNLDKISTNPSK